MLPQQFASIHLYTWVERERHYDPGCDRTRTNLTRDDKRGDNSTLHQCTSTLVRTRSESCWCYVSSSVVTQCFSEWKCCVTSKQQRWLVPWRSWFGEIGNRFLPGKSVYKSVRFWEVEDCPFLYVYECKEKSHDTCCKTRTEKSYFAPADVHFIRLAVRTWGVHEVHSLPGYNSEFWRIHACAHK